MFVVIFLCIFFLQLQAMDDGSDLIPATPAAFIQRLEERECTSSKVYWDESFVLKKFHKNSIVWEGSPIKNYMKECCVGPYDKYLVSLASSTALNPEEKISSDWIDIPPFKELSDDNRGAVISMCLTKVNSKTLYPITRILLLSLVSNKKEITGKQGKQLLVKAAQHDDLSLIKRVLALGIEPERIYGLNDRCPLLCCKSQQAAQLLMESGADVHCLEILLTEEIKKHLHESKNKKSQEFLDYLMFTVPLNKSNGFGWSFMQSIANAYALRVDSEQLGICLRKLLEHSFACDEETKKEICVLAGKKSAETREKIQEIFKECQNPGQNIKG